MSGTSFDGIDAAVGGHRARRRRGDADAASASSRAPYDDELRADIEAALPPAQTTLETVCRLDTRIGQAFADARGAGAGRATAPRRADRLPRPDALPLGRGRRRGTLQLGQPAWIAERTGLPVVADLRARDVAAGGQGAPLVSLLDTLLLADAPARPAALNLGGIANLTVPPIAFDTGPANALLDAAARHFTGRPYDEDGAARREPAPSTTRCSTRLLADPYYARPAPKTTGKEHFHAAYARRSRRAAPRTCSPRSRA